MEFLLLWQAVKLAIVFFLLVAVIGWRVIAKSDTISPLGVSLMYGGAILASLGLTALVIRSFVL